MFSSSSDLHVPLYPRVPKRLNEASRLSKFKTSNMFFWRMHFVLKKYICRNRASFIIYVKHKRISGDEVWSPKNVTSALLNVFTNI